jgi:uncharacterized protein YihD (DUF1040 family)
MRNKTRIKKILGELGKVWEKHPDLRLGQLLRQVTYDEDLFYLEDDVLLVRIGALNKKWS